MAFTTADLDALDRAISSGELRVRLNDREVTYRSTEELLSARVYISTQLATASTAKQYPRHQLADFSDE